MEILYILFILFFGYLCQLENILITIPAMNNYTLLLPKNVKSLWIGIQDNYAGKVCQEWRILERTELGEIGEFSNN